MYMHIYDIPQATKNKIKTVLICTSIFYHIQTRTRICTSIFMYMYTYVQYTHMYTHIYVTYTYKLKDINHFCFLLFVFKMKE